MTASGDPDRARRAGTGQTTQITPDGGLQIREQRLVVRVMRGPDTGLEVELGDLAVGIGTHPSNQLVLTDGRASRFHLELVRGERGARALDLDSANGTTAGRLRVRDVYVGDGTVLELGDSAIEIRALGETTHDLPASETFGELLARSLAMRRVFAIARREIGRAHV